MVKDIAPGLNWSSPQNLTAIGDRLLFAADDGETGREAWITCNGTDAARFTDIAPERAWSDPRSFVASGSQLFFVANDRAHGEELWSAPLAPLSQCTAQDDSSGDGCTITAGLRPDLAPKHVAQIKKLARAGFYAGVIFHRVIEGFMAQTGDPTGTGMGGSKEPDLPAEFSNAHFDRGTLGMARSQDPNSANSQFFVMFADGGWDRFRAANPAQFAEFQAREFPWGRLGSPEEVADVVVFLLSERARWINGAHIAVDGAQGRPTAI